MSHYTLQELATWMGVKDFKQYIEERKTTWLAAVRVERSQIEDTPKPDTSASDTLREQKETSALPSQFFQRASGSFSGANLMLGRANLDFDMFDDDRFSLTVEVMGHSTQKLEFELSSTEHQTYRLISYKEEKHDAGPWEPDEVGISTLDVLTGQVDFYKTYKEYLDGKPLMTRVKTLDPARQETLVRSLCTTIAHLRELTNLGLIQSMATGVTSFAQQAYARQLAGYE